MNFCFFLYSWSTSLFDPSRCVYRAILADHQVPFANNNVTFMACACMHELDATQLLGVRTTTEYAGILTSRHSYVTFRRRRYRTRPSRCCRVIDETVETLKAQYSCFKFLKNYCFFPPNYNQYKLKTTLL